ncbi:MAG: hypothetical protein PHU80_00595 [Kiritimatiellae bacterium]|nr:hypothetical protein [Kiritimatiellia bacterium]
MSTATLTSLAMLKVNVDQGRDYLDYLRPFILQVLCDHNPSPITDAGVRDFIREDFGLEIPERAVQMVLKRLTRKYPLKRELGVYLISGDLPNPRIAAGKADADRHIRAVVAGLKDLSKNTSRPIASDEEAVQAICMFLSEFNIPCLRAYLRGTAIPPVENHDDALVVLVSKYVLSLHDSDPERFSSFLIVVKGHMLANALLCPDLQKAPKTYNGVSFYFDTPLLVRILGLEGQAKQTAVENLITLLQNLGARVAVFSHSRSELERVVRGAADYIDSPNGRGAIILEARRTGKTKSDVLIIAGQIDDMLDKAGIEVVRTPHYDEAYQIDESAFAGVLKDEVSYHNPRAKEDDINSVRSIYALRHGSAPMNVEHAKAVLVTSNSGFAHAAYEFGKDFEETREVSSVISDFSLANMAWLKAPMGAPDLPMTEVIAFSYAALQPSKELLDKYLSEIDKLEKRGTITERDHQLLRSSDLAQRELMNLTLGEEEALSEKTIAETLDRVTSEIKKEESAKYKAEQTQHRQTQQTLASEREEKQAVQKRLYWRCYRNANSCAGLISGLLSLFLLVGLGAGIGLTSNNRVTGWILVAGMGILILVTLGNLMVGTTVAGLHRWVHKRCLTWFLKRESKAIGFDLEKV